MKKHWSLMRIAQLLTAVILFAGGGLTSVATAQITYGTLDNFDVINDTGGECHGFEIELEGISTADVVYTFGAPYQRYGDPTVMATSGGTGVTIRYAASYAGTWSATTPIAVAPYLPTQGHSCWTGGVTDPAIYYASGCDHFGASLNTTPTKTTYRWLVENPSAPGTLMVFGTNVPLPAPVWNVTPPADPAAQPVAAAAIAPPPPADPTKCGDAMWVKVYVTELPNGLQGDDLDHMVIDDPNVNIVPNEPVEVEFEWVLLQACPGNAGEQEFGGAAEVGAGNEAVSRRFEFYKYTGQYDPDPEAIREALCDNPTEPAQQIPERCGDPNADGVAGVGDLIGAQNAAINLAGPFGVPNQPPVADNQSVTTDEDVDVSITLTASDADANSLTYGVVTGPAHGTLSGTAPNLTYHPALNYNGPDSFTFKANDGQADSNVATVSITVNAVNDPPVADAGTDQAVRFHDIVTLDGSGSSDVDGDTLTYSWAFTAKPAHSKAALIGATSVNPTFTVDKDGTYQIGLVVNDGTVDSAAATVTITATKGKK